MSDIFAIAASITINGGSAMKFLDDFGGKLLGIHGHMEKLQGQLKEVHRLAVGVGTAFVGYETLKGLMHLAEHGKELNHQQSMLLRNGIAYKDVIEETTKAYQKYTQLVPTASGPDFLRTANELVSVKGTLKGADDALVQSLKIEGLIGNATGKSAEGQGYDFWRAVEDKGIIQNKQLTDTFLNAMAQATIGTGGKITGADWFTYARRAGTSWMGDALEALPMQVMEMQTLGAPGAGVSRRTFANMIEGGQKLTKAQTKAWNDIGMMDAHGIAGRETEASRPDEFIQRVIDSLQKHGIMGEEATKLWASHALNRKAADYFMTGYMGMTERDETGKTRLEKERANLGRAQGLDKAYDTMMHTDMTANLTALNEQWKSLMEAVGGPLAKMAIPVLRDLTSAINGMAAFADRHQEFTKVAGELTAVAGGVMLLAGSVTALRAALAVSAALKGGGAGISFGGAGAAAAGVAGAAAGAVPAGPKVGWQRYLGVLGLGYDAATMGDPNSEGWQKTREANQAQIGDLGRFVRDRLPWGQYLHFSDDPRDGRTKDDRVNVDRGDGYTQPFPGRPNIRVLEGSPEAYQRTALNSEGNALHRNDEMPAAALKASIAKTMQDLPAAVDTGLKPVGDHFKAGVAKIPSETQPAIDAMARAIAAQISRALAGIAGQVSMPALAVPGGQRQGSLPMRRALASATFDRSRGPKDVYGSWLPPGADAIDTA